MKKFLVFLCAILMLIGFSLSANAAPYVGADIVINGADRIDDYGHTTWQWEEYGDAIGCRSNGWVLFSPSLEPGNWNIGLNVTNFDGPPPDGYPGFEIILSTDANAGVPLSLPLIPAVDGIVNHSYVNLDIAAGGPYEYCFDWINDAWEGDGADANIMIISAFFDNTATASVPEPATMLLLGSGLIGLVGFRRKFKK